MPFINEVLDSNRLNNQLAQEKEKLARTPVPWLSRFAFDPSDIETELNRQIIGQDEVIASLCRQLMVIKAGLHDSNRPLCVTLLVGNTGVGKTELVRCLAQLIHGNKQSFCRIDMNTLSQSHYSAAITGAPPGYVGSKENVTLIDAETVQGSSTRPGIVLFDEIEKASSEVTRSLMNILDNGILNLASGNKQLSFRNSLVFMTSNLGANTQWSAFRELIYSRNKQQRHLDAIRHHFDPEFINRIDRIEIMQPLKQQHARHIVQLEVDRLNAMLVKKHIVIELDDAAVRFLAEQGFDAQFGARAMKRAVRDHLLVPLSELLVVGTLPSEGDKRLLGKVSEGKIFFQSL